MEMQMQQEFAAYSWGNNGSLWGSESILLRDDFDLNSIPPIELGVPKYTESLTLAAPNALGLEFGHEFSDALQRQQYLDDSRDLGGLLGFDELMAGHGRSSLYPNGEANGRGQAVAIGTMNRLDDRTG
jgi:hypothetical protein